MKPDQSPAVTVATPPLPETTGDECLRTLVDRIEVLSRENSRLVTERDAAGVRIADMEARLVAITAAGAAVSGQERPNAPPEPFIASVPAWRRAPERVKPPSVGGWWRFWRR
jgi:hypothetical protein